MSDLILRASRRADGRAVIEALLGDRVVARDAVDLQSAEDRRRFARLVVGAVPALPIETIEAELLAIDAERLPGADEEPGPDDPWEDPTEIEIPKGGVFPADVLPEPLRSWVEAVAVAYQVPADLPGLLGIAIASGAVARRVEIDAGRGWREPLNLYVACLLDPGNRKSAVFREAMSPLRTIEAELIESKGPEIAKRQSERRMREKELANLEKKAASGGKDSGGCWQRAIDLAEDLQREPMPMMPKLCVDDATSESIEKSLVGQGGRMIVAGAEGGLFDVLQGRYSNGAISLDIFLKGHAGDDLRVDRITRGSVVVDRPALTLAYAIQPQVIEGLAENPAFRGRGLIGRFIYSFPVSTLGEREINPEPLADELKADYAAVIRSLFDWADAFADDPEPRRLCLSEDAWHLFLQWQGEIEPMLGPRGALASMTDWGGKLAGLTARMAAVLHLVRYAACPDPALVPVGVESIEAAITLGRWAVPHARATYSLLGSAEASQSKEDAVYVLTWLREQRKPEITRRDIGQHGRARFGKDAERLTGALNSLTDAGWIRPIGKLPQGPGRPSERYRCHPSIYGAPSRPPGADDRVRGVI